MAKCFSFTASRDRCYRHSFENAGLRSTTADLGDGTIMHCWAPKKHKETKPILVLIHGLGANAMWQWGQFIHLLIPRFNIYVPDLIFFGESYTTRPDRNESFQAQCVVRMMEAVAGVKRMSVVGISYGGFVAYRMAAEYPGAVERVALCCAGVCLEEEDMEEGLFRVATVEAAADILLPQTPGKLRELMRLSFYKPRRNVPSCFLSDFIHVMCTEYRQQRKELINALLKDRKLANLPRISQPTLIIWGEQDQIFPLELAHRLKRHLGDNAKLVIIKKAGHAVNMEKPKEMYKHLKSFFVDSPANFNSTINGKKSD